MLLDIQENRVADVVVWRMSGKLALGRESQRIETMIEDLAKSGPAKVVMDMMDVSYIDSAGIGLVAMAAGRLKEGGGKLALVAAVDGRPTQLLKLTQIDAIVPLCATMDEAMAAVA